MNVSHLAQVLKAWAGCPQEGVGSESKLGEEDFWVGGWPGTGVKIEQGEKDIMQKGDMGKVSELRWSEVEVCKMSEPEWNEEGICMKVEATAATMTD